MTKSKLNWRGMTTLLLMLTMMVNVVSGLVLYITPFGRFANWNHWALLGLDKHQWQSVHTIFSFLLLAIVTVHLYFNWRVVVHFVWSKMQQSVNLKKELTVSLVIVMAILVGTLWGSQPFSGIMDFGHDVKLSWEKNSPATVHGRGATPNPIRTESANFHPRVAGSADGPMGRGQGRGGGWGRRQVETRASEVEHPSPWTLKGRDIARSGRMETLSGALVRQNDEWGIRSSKQIFDIHLGPERYRRDLGVKLKPGEPVTVSGFVHGRDVAVTTLTYPGGTIRFRDASGRPAWAGTRYSSRHQ